MNYGVIGMILGHEITHGYDNKGRLHDGYGINTLNCSKFKRFSKGNVREWWDKTTYLNFQKKKECFINQYGSIKIPINLNLTSKIFFLNLIF